MKRNLILAVVVIAALSLAGAGGVFATWSDSEVSFNNSIETGRAARAMCKVGCIGCGICVKQTDQFSVTDNLARLDYSKYEPGEAAETAMTKCPTGVIVYRGPTAPAPREPKEKSAAKKT